MLMKIHSLVVVTDSNGSLEIIADGNKSCGLASDADRSLLWGG